ncbi:MAG: radical SAM protein, partial [Desulfobacterium sp.]|nr:radical SAM protein [Desulfobacterium sp.]MBU4035523.1 radical SAM protein [Pseudomonadota bacterium]
MPEIKQHFFYFEGKTADFFPSVGLKLSGNCRFKCPFCCEPNRTQQVYPLNNFISIANILKKLGTRRLCFTGGDPLSHKDIGALLQYTKSLDFFNLLLTTDAKALK